MRILNLDHELLLNFVAMYLVVLVSLNIIAILLLLFVKLQRKIYIRAARNEIEKIKGKEQTIFCKVEDNIENKLHDLGKCVLVIKGFDSVCDTLRRHWSPDEELKLIYIIEGDYSIDVELFFNNDGSWKEIEGLYNLSDGINYVNLYEIAVKENEKIKSIQQMLFISCIAMWVGIIPILTSFFFTDQFIGALKFDREILMQIMIPIMFMPLFFQVIMYFVAKKLQRDDEDSQLSRIIQIFIMAMPVYSILISFIYLYLLKQNI